MRAFIKRIIDPFIQFWFKKYYKKPRRFRYADLEVLVYPEVFPPHFTFSTKILLNYIKELDMEGKTFLELGCGSGIISLFASSKGAKVTATDINELRVLAKEFENAFAAGERGDARGINYRFHRRLYDIANMPQTLHFVQMLWARYPFDLINAASGRGDSAAKEHDEILNAFTSRDTSAAMLAMRKHIESGWDVLQAATS